MNLTTRILQEQANVARRAETLFEDGYRVTKTSPSGKSGKVYEVTSPEGHTYTVDTLMETCTCPYFEKRNPQVADDPFFEDRLFCKHYLGVERLAEQCEAEACEMDVESYLRWKQSEEAIY